MTEGPRVAAAIPALDAGPWLEEVVARTLLQVPRVVVVDDGSRDDTGLVARRAGAEVLTHRSNRGKSAALRTAFEHLLEEDWEAVVSLDADGQHLPEEIPHLLAASDAADLVLGSRHLLFGGMSGVRRWSNRLSSRAISWACGVDLPDAQTGFRLHRRALLERVPVAGERFSAESALLVRAARRGFRIAFVPVKLGFVDGRHTSHYRPLLDSLRIAAAVARARFEPVASRPDGVADRERRAG